MTNSSTQSGETYHTEHLVDRAAMLAMRAIIALQPAADFGPNGRVTFDQLMERTPAADDVTYEAATVGGVSGWWCLPAAALDDAAILYLHGGGYVVGSARAYSHFVGQIAARAHVRIFVADYGLAPERPYPAAVNDAEAAYRGMAQAGWSKIAIAGDSAGGGLALVTTARMINLARTNAVPRPIAAAVMSPWTDLALTGTSVVTRAKHDPLLSAAGLEAARESYIGQHDPADPGVSPLYGDLADLPPTMLHVGEDEILLDDARRYADRLQQSGSSAELHVWKGMTHVFPTSLALLRAAREATDNVGEFLRYHLRSNLEGAQEGPA